MLNLLFGQFPAYRALPQDTPPRGVGGIFKPDCAQISFRGLICAIR